MSILRKLKLIYPYKSFYKVPYLVPPWDERQKSIFINYLITKRNIDDNAFVGLIKKSVKCNSNVIFIDSGRSALRILLKNLSFPAGSEFIVPVLCCGVVPEAMTECGLVPFFADIGDDLCLTLKSIKAAITPLTKGVVLIHAGGAAAKEYSQILEFCKKEGLYLIDNAAQGWGNEIEGSWLGARGNAGIVSFGLGKSTFGIGGGLLFSDLSKINDINGRRKYSRASLIRFYLQYLKRSHTAPLFMHNNRFMGSDAIEGISYLDMAIQLSILKNLHNLIQKRSEISLKIISILNHPNVSFPQINNKHSWTKLIVRLPENLRITLQKFLYMHSVESEDYYRPFYLNNSWFQKGRFLRPGYSAAEDMYKELIILPNSPGLNPNQLNYLYRILGRFKKRYL